MHCLISTLRAVAALALLAAVAMTIGLVAEELGDRGSVAASDQARVDAVPSATATACQTRELSTALSQLPRSDVRWRWADLPDGVVGTAYLRSRNVLLDPTMDCGDVASTAYHEWAHIMTADYYGGTEMLTGTVTGEQTDEATGRPYQVSTNEIVADCAAGLLSEKFGARFTLRPYLDRAGGCPPELLSLAREIVAFGGVQTSTLPAVPLGPIGNSIA